MESAELNTRPTFASTLLLLRRKDGGEATH